MLVRPGALVWLGVAVTAQLLAVWMLNGVNVSTSLGAAFACGLLIGISLLVRWQLPFAAMRMISATLAYGGLGMAVGALLDQAMASAAHAHHGAMHQHGHGAMVWQWGLMTVCCAVVCWRHCGLVERVATSFAVSAAKRKFVMHFSYLAGMFIGMLLAMYAAVPLLETLLGKDGAMHFWMLVGMGAGVGVVDFCRFFLFSVNHENQGSAVRH